MFRYDSGLGQTADGACLDPIKTLGGQRQQDVFISVVIA